jgi:hypothetical protein
VIDAVLPPPRRVFVLGGYNGTDPTVAVRRALEAGCEVVLIAVGYPLSQQQRRVVETTIALVNTMHGTLDAMLVASADELARHLLPGDRVEVLASASSGTAFAVRWRPCT